MKNNITNKTITQVLASTVLGCLCLLPVACTQRPAAVTVEGTYLEVTSALDSVTPSAEAEAIINEYRQRVIDEQAPVLGYAPADIERGKPEGLMNNFEADVLFEAGCKANGAPVDVAIANYGGIRNMWNAGDVTIGDIYRAFPFENCLTLATVNGSQLLDLFRSIAHDGGHPISGAALVINPDGELITCDVQGKPIVDSQKYRVATLDYLAEGNDGMTAFKEATDVAVLTDLTIRALITEKVKALTAAGQPIAPQLDGRITVVDVN